MLIIFESNAHTDVMMFADIAKSLIKMMGHSGTIPSAIAAKDVPAALEHLKKGLEAESSEELQETDNDEEDNDEEDNDEEDNDEVSISGRAFPLVEMLKAAARENEPIMWYQKK
jgi:NH3-dependent NAD+ synthetase